MTKNEPKQKMCVICKIRPVRFANECVCASHLCCSELYRQMNVADKQIASMPRGSFS